MRESDIPAIRSLELFREMADESFAELVRGAYVQNFPPNMELIVEGDECDFLHIVVDGTVELFANWNERETVMTILGEGATFILAAAIRDAPNLMSARTLVRSRVIMLPSEDVRHVFEKDHAFARAVVMELAYCYRGVIKGVKGLKLRTSIERLANYLLKWQKKLGGASEFALPVEKRRLASILGMTPENLSRSIKSLRPYGVEITGQVVKITKPEDLKTLAKPTALIDDPRS
ncbi:MAG: cyclic nucleotide-binding domain-containing protein [Rhodobacteraceae bacterium]|nr:cyclic nucleotide-binding domain-containing protein [Paracoccaceae bacterium]